MRQLYNYNPVFFGTDAVNIMVIHDWDSFDIYYQIAGTPFTFAFGIPDSEGFHQARRLAIANIDNYVEVLFNE